MPTLHPTRRSAHLLGGGDERAAGPLAFHAAVLHAALGAGRLLTGPREAQEAAVLLRPGLQEAGLTLLGEGLPQVGDGRRHDGEGHLLRGDDPVPGQKVHRLLVKVEVPATERAATPGPEAGGPGSRPGRLLGIPWWRGEGRRAQHTGLARAVFHQGLSLTSRRLPCHLQSRSYLGGRGRLSFVLRGPSPSPPSAPCEALCRTKERMRGRAGSALPPGENCFKFRAQTRADVI